MGGYANLIDMVDGGGAGRSGDKFEDGGMVSMLANMLAKPYGSQQQAQQEAPPMRVSTSGGPRPQPQPQPQPNAPPPHTAFRGYGDNFGPALTPQPPPSHEAFRGYGENFPPVVNMIPSVPPVTTTEIPMLTEPEDDLIVDTLRYLEELRNGTR